MIARIWRGAVARTDGDAYADYMEGAGVAAYAATSGNRGVWMLRRTIDDKTEFLMFTLWDSLEAVKAFAGETPELAVFYPEDDNGSELDQLLRRPAPQLSPRTTSAHVRTDGV